MGVARNLAINASAACEETTTMHHDRLAYRIPHYHFSRSMRVLQPWCSLVQRLAYSKFTAYSWVTLSHGNLASGTNISPWLVQISPQNLVANTLYCVRFLPPGNAVTVSLILCSALTAVMPIMHHTHFIELTTVQAPISNPHGCFKLA